MRLKISQLFVIFVLSAFVLFFGFFFFSFPSVLGKASVSAVVVSSEILNLQQFLSLSGANDFDGVFLALAFKGIDQESDNATFVLYGCKTVFKGKCVQVDEDEIIMIVKVPEKSSISGNLKSFIGIPYVKEELFLEKINYSSNPESLTVVIKTTQNA